MNDLTFQYLDQRQQGAQLFKTTLLKALLSSPVACLETVKNRIRRLQNQPGGAIQHDVEQLQELHQALLDIEVNSISKFQTLLHLIQNVFQWRGKGTKDRLVIFTSRIETLKFSQTQLTQALTLKPEAVVTLDGSKSDIEQNTIVEAFGQEQSPVRILIATEVASEGLNLYYLSHKLIHFDIPWSLMRLQQRNGRIDRYGQQRQPEIRYLLTRSKLERMDEVERIIKVLLDKDEQAIKNIGDPSVFMGVFNPDAEEAVTAQAIETGTTSAQFSDQLHAQAKQFTEDLDLFTLFANSDQSSPSEPPQTIHRSSLPSLFSSTFDYVAAGLQALETPPVNLNINTQARFIELYLPPESLAVMTAYPRNSGKTQSCT